LGPCQFGQLLTCREALADVLQHWVFENICHVAFSTLC
jgi:hypothetical protein